MSDIEREDIPGTEYLVDVGHKLDVSHAKSGKSDIVRLPQPAPCDGDTLKWPQYKKYWQLGLLALYACAFSFGENNLGAAWTTVAEEAGVTISTLNGGGALNYLLLGFGNIFWIPAAMKIGRRPVFMATMLICLASTVWNAKFYGSAQWYLSCLINGIAVSAYEAVIQLSIFDMFFVHERGGCLAFYIFGQQLGSILGLITGGAIADSFGWRWACWISVIIDGVVLLLFFLTFEETLFPRYLFNAVAVVAPTSAKGPEAIDNVAEKGPIASEAPTMDVEVADNYVNIPKRSYPQMLKLWNYQRYDRTTYWQYFKRPFFLFAFPPIFLSGLIFAFGCTAGIVSFNTISEILTEAPYNWSTTAAGLVFLAALVGSIVGWATGILADRVVLLLARRNGGVKEPEMRLWTLPICFVYAAVGYFLYGWGAQTGASWVTIAIGIGCMIAHQVSACSIATAYAMDSFPGVTGELVVVLAICSSCINFAISESTQPFIEATSSYGWPFTFYGLCVLSSMLMGVPMIIYGKRWRIKHAPRYRLFLQQRSAAGEA